MTNQQQTYCQPFFIVKQSSIHSQGAFAKILIPKGTHIIEYIGEKITITEAQSREQQNQKTGATYIFILDDEYCLDGAVNGNESASINHSCDPNCETELINGKIWIIALRDILPGEELTYDYEFDSDDPVRDRCYCHSKNCRGFIQLDRS